MTTDSVISRLPDDRHLDLKIISEILQAVTQCGSKFRTLHRPNMEKYEVL